MFRIVISLDNGVNCASKSDFLSMMKRFAFQIVISFENGVNSILDFDFL